MPWPESAARIATRGASPCRPRFESVADPPPKLPRRDARSAGDAERAAKCEQMANSPKRMLYISYTWVLCTTCAPMPGSSGQLRVQRARKLAALSPRRPQPFERLPSQRRASQASRPAERRRRGPRSVVAIHEPSPDYRGTEAVSLSFGPATPTRQRRRGSGCATPSRWRVWPPKGTRAVPAKPQSTSCRRPTGEPRLPPGRRPRRLDDRCCGVPAAMIRGGGQAS